MKLLLQVADRLVEKGHVHATSIKSWVAAVDKRYKDFSCRMEKHRVKLETTLGLKHDVSNGSLYSDPSFHTFPSFFSPSFPSFL